MNLPLTSFQVDVAAYLMIAMGVGAFIALQKLPSAYGRYSVGAGGIYALQMNGRVAWILQELPSLLGVIVTVATASREQQAKMQSPEFQPNKVLQGLFVLHYIHRTFIFPFRLRAPKPTPVVLFVAAAAFCSYNGVMQSQSLLVHASYPTAYLSSAQFLVGLCIFFTGMFINITSDNILMNLRKPGETGYKIPMGGMFQYVSGANFFGEILEWTGFAVAAGTLPAAAFAVFTFCNTAPRGAQHHANYLQKFKDQYPKDRKAVIPFIW